MQYVVIGFLLFQIACISSAKLTPKVENEKAERKTLQKGSAVIKSPARYEKRETEKGEYDPKPRVVLIDEKAGKYELRWIGYDGKEKIIQYQRADAIDAVVEAKIEKIGDGFVYRYLIRNLPSSATYVSGFIVQTLTDDIKYESAPTVNNVHIGQMSRHIPQFSDGVWKHFALLDKAHSRVEPGKNVEFTFVSAALPGLVKCKAAGGELTLKGVGEHMPSELEASIPGYDELANGYTIGPIDRLSHMSKAESSKYVLDNLTKFEQLGWMSPNTATIYKRLLEREDLPGALSQAKKDLETEFITHEVYYIIQGLSGGL